MSTVYGVPYAIAAKFAFPGRVSVAMVGDGAMQMGGMAEMLAAANYRQVPIGVARPVSVEDVERLEVLTYNGGRMWVGATDFADHVRLQAMLFDGAVEAAGGMLRPDLSRPGLGVGIKRPDAGQFRVG